MAFHVFETRVLRGQPTKYFCGLEASPAFLTHQYFEGWQGLRKEVSKGSWAVSSTFVSRAQPRGPLLARNGCRSMVPRLRSGDNNLYMGADLNHGAMIIER